MSDDHAFLLAAQERARQRAQRTARPEEPARVLTAEEEKRIKGYATPRYHDFDVPGQTLFWLHFNPPVTPSEAQAAYPGAVPRRGQ